MVLGCGLIENTNLSVNFCMAGSFCIFYIFNAENRKNIKEASLVNMYSMETVS